MVVTTHSFTIAASGASAPTLATDGFDLNGATSFKVTVSSTTGQTLNGAQTLNAYYYNGSTERWGTNPDLDLTRTITGVRDTTWGDQDVKVPKGRFYLLPNTCTISGGSNVVVTFEVKRG